MRTVTCAILTTLAFAACEGPSNSGGPGVEIAIAPLTLPGLSKVCYDLRVTNGADGAGTTVFAKGDSTVDGLLDTDHLCSTQFGNGAGGGITFVGACDATPVNAGDTGRTNSVTVWVDSLFATDGGLVAQNGADGWQDPCPSGCTLNTLCQENSDTRVEFNLSILRQANQGFFDIGVNFEDVFCSAKVDCVNSSNESLKLLFRPGTSTRDTTIVAAFACTAGAGAGGTTHLYRDPLKVTCGATVTELAPNVGKGNAWATAAADPNSGDAIWQYAIYADDESLTCNGQPCNKRYWNVAIGLDPTVDNCILTTRMTASASALSQHSTPLATTYPFIDVNVSLTNTSGLTCTKHPLNGNNGVSTSYTGIASPEVFDYAFDGTGFQVNSSTSPSSSGSGPDTDAQAFITAANITDATQISAIQTLVTSMKSAGLWSKMKAIYPMVGGTAQAHKFNLKDPRDLDTAFRLQFNGGWFHSASGAKPNGIDTYALTMFNPTAQNLSLSSQHLSYFSLTQSNGNEQEMSANSGLSSYNNFLAIYYLGTGNLRAALGTNSRITAVLNGNPTIGFFLANRPSLTSVNVWRNGVKVASDTSTALGNDNVHIRLGSGDAGTDFSRKECAFASIGEGLTDSEAIAFYDAVQAFQTALGRQPGAVASTGSEAEAFISAAGITDGTQVNAIKALVASLKSSGVWLKLRAIYPMVGGTASAHKFNLKDPRDLDAAFRLQFVGPWVHSPTGAKPNGVDTYALTNFNPSAQLLPIESQHLSYYSRTQVVGAEQDISANSSPTNNNFLAIYYQPTAGLRTALATNTRTVVSLPGTPTTGLFVSNRSSLSVINVWRDGVKVVSDTTTALGNDNVSIRLGSGDGMHYSRKECAFATIGEGLSDSEAVAFYQAVQTFQTALGRQVGVPMVSDSDAQAFLGVAGITQYTQAMATDALVADLKAAGLWNKMKAVYPFVGGTVGTHKWNLRDPRDADNAFRLSFNGAMTHDASGVLFDGASGYALTFFTPSTHLTASDNAHVSWYNIIPNASSGWGAYTQAGSGTRFLFQTTTSILDWRLNVNTTFTTVTYPYSSSGKGHFMTTRTVGSNAIRVFAGGALLTSTSASLAPPAIPLAFGARNADGVVKDFDAARGSFVTLGDSLSSAEAANLYAAIQTFQTSLGRQVGAPLYDNDLALRFDAGHTGSYPGSGTSWFDLATSHVGTLTGGPSYSATYGGHLTFDGVDDFVSLSNTTNFTSPSYSLSVWCRNASFSDYQTLVYKGDGQGVGTQFGLSFNAAGQVLFQSNQGGSVVDTITANTWNLHTVTYDASTSTVKYYRNGVLRHESLKTSTVMNQNIRFGADPASGRYFHGSLAMVLLNSRVLSVAEVTQHFENTRGRFGL